MSPTAILHLMNNLADSSISRIVERIISHSDASAWQWHVGSTGKSNEMEDRYRALGAATVSFSGENSRQLIRNYLLEKGIGLIHTHTPRTIFEGWRALALLPPAHRPRHLATKHLLTRPGDRKWGLAFFLADRLSLYLPDLLAPVSLTMAREIIAQPGIQPRRVTAIPNGIPCEQFYQPEARTPARRELGLPDDAVVFGYAGRLDQVKRLDLLLEAFAEIQASIPEARLLVLGEGSMKTAWQAEAQRLGISSAVVWAGFRADTGRMLAAMDIYMQPSSNEGLSLSILEAMSAMRPVIATQVGAAQEVLTDQVTGILVVPNSAGALAQAMRWLVDHPDQKRQIAEAANQLVNRSYHVVTMVTGYQNLYQRLMEGDRHA